MMNDKSTVMLTSEKQVMSGKEAFDTGSENEPEGTETDASVEDSTDAEASNRDWETSAYVGLMFSLAKYKNRLEERRGFKLNSKPREIDVRIIDKLSGVDLKEDPGMCKALRELMKDEIQEELDNAVAAATEAATKAAAAAEMRNREDSARAMLADGIEEANVARYTGLGIERVREMAKTIAAAC